MRNYFKQADLRTYGRLMGAVVVIVVVVVTRMMLMMTVVVAVTVVRTEQILRLGLGSNLW